MATESLAWKPDYCDRASAEAAQSPAAQEHADLSQEYAVGVSKPDISSIIGVSRHAVEHKVLLLPYVVSDKDSIDISSIVSSVEINEEVGKDISAKVRVVNHNFALSDVIFFEAGRRIGLWLFDGVIWRNFGPFRIVNPGKSFAETSEFDMDLRSDAVLWQTVLSRRWEGRSLADIYTDLSIISSFELIIDWASDPEGELSAPQPSITMAKESILQFLNRLDKRFGLWHDFDGVSDSTGRRVLRLSKRKLGETNIVLKYRPPSPEIGSIFSAEIEEQAEHPKKGRKGKKPLPTVHGLDFNAGTADAKLIEDIQNYGLSSVAENLFRGDPKTEDEFDSKFGDAALLDMKASLARMPVAGAGSATEAIDPDDPYLYIAVRYAEPDDFGKPHSSVDADRLRKVLHSHYSLEKFAIDLETYGQTDIRLKTILHVEGLGVEDGPWAVMRIQHKFTDKGYRMKIRGNRHDKPTASGKVLPKSPVQSLAEATAPMTKSDIPVENAPRYEFRNGQRVEVGR